MKCTIEGREGGDTLVFVHGWPDNPTLWRNQVEALGEHYRCVLVTLPNFGEESVKAGGYDFPELTKQLAATIQEVQPEGKVGLVTHDWGAYLGYLLEQAEPELVASMAALDVGGDIQPKGLLEPLMILSYQWALIWCWLVGGIIPPLGDLLTRGVAKVVDVPARQRADIRSRYNYVYYYCLLYTSPSPRDQRGSRMPSSA